MALTPLVPVAAGALGAWAYGTYEPNSPLFGRAIGRGPTRERVAYLTFDDGPNPRATEPILETLAASATPAVFFLVGEHVRRFPAVATLFDQRVNRYSPGGRTTPGEISNGSNSRS